MSHPRVALGRTLATIVVGLVGLASAAPVLAAPPEVPDHLRAYSITPPGQSGFVSLAEGASGQFGPHVTDQLDMYASLVDDDDVTEAELDDYFHSFQFGPGPGVTREYSPTEGATVYRDSLDIPHVYADTDGAAAFALGYVTAEDRLWQMDLLRHAGKGRLSELLGPDFVETDEALRRDGYSEAELQKMFDTLDDRHGADGAKLQQLITQYVAGVNKRMTEVRADFSLMPAEYLGQGLPAPRAWTVTDTAGTVILQLRRFGETAGEELSHAALYQQLRKNLGSKLGARAFRDFVMANAPSEPTIQPQDGAFPSQQLGRPDPRAVAIPDRSKQLVARLSAHDTRVARSLKKIVLGMPASNFIAVAPELSTTGHTLEFGAPQVGYTVPQFFMEIDVHSPTFDFRGPAVPGASLLVPLGRGSDFAWSLATGGSDAVDVRVELLCARSGAVSKTSNSYMFKGRCRNMESRTESIEVKGGDAKRVKIYRTVHGPVIARGTVGLRPVAIVKERFFWKNEISSVLAFLDMNSNEMDDVQEFQAAIAKVTMSFNAVYADDEHIAYFHAGTFPQRAEGVDPMLPSWGTGQWEWQGRIPFSRQPKVIDPAQGWIVNWNNKPSSGWRNGDDSMWGPTHRVRLLSQQMEREGGTFELSDVVDVIRRAATQDARALFVGPQMLEASQGVTGPDRAARDQVIAWITAGAHRTDHDRDNEQDASAAVATFDLWFTKLAHRIFDDELKGAYPYLVPIMDGPHPGGSSMYSDFSNYIELLLDPTSSDNLARNYCDDRSTGAAETCAEQIRAALQDAVSELTATQGADVSTWTAAADYIDFGAVGAAHVPSIPWQNRGTYNHAVEILGHRP